MVLINFLGFYAMKCHMNLDVDIPISTSKNGWQINMIIDKGKQPDIDF